MIILVNGKKAMLKSGFSFEYVTENRLFLGRDGYTLSITFPLKDCPQNLEIFGQIHRLDADKKGLSFECAIIDSHVSLFGTLSIVKLSEVEVECQFSEGRCEQVATDPFDETFVNELNIGSYPYINASEISPLDAWQSCDNGMNAVALPWVNEAYPDVPNNWATFSGTVSSWASEVTKLSWQPYLLYIAKQICNAIGYDCDFSEWEQSDYRYLIICNTLPASWDNPTFATALPHWTVSEFFEKLELLLKCEFDFDHRTKSVRFSFTKKVIDDIAPVRLPDVVDKYTAEIAQDDSRCDYIGAKRIAYKDCGHMMSNFYACDWLVVGAKYREYPDVQTMIDANKRQDLERDTPAGHVKEALWGAKTITSHGFRYSIHGLMYAKAEKTFFTMRSIGTEFLCKDNFNKEHYTQIYVLQPLNVFGSGIVENDDTDTEEIEFCPVCISDTYVSLDDDMGYMMYLSFSSPDESTSSDVTDKRDQSVIRQIPFVDAIIDGQKDSRGSAYYDVVYVAFWDGAYPKDGAQPYPFIDPITVRQDWVLKKPHIPDIRIYGSENGYEVQIPMIDKKKKFKFSWLSNEIPNPRAIFYIRGKKFLCEKITATFTENGMSQLLKGEFYPILEEPQSAPS